MMEHARAKLLISLPEMKKSEEGEDPTVPFKASHQALPPKGSTTFQQYQAVDQFFFFVISTWVSAQGTVLARQALYHLSHSTNPFL
jgi:hypothetical protein